MPPREPDWTNGLASLYCADARDLPLDDESVDCIVTSPPYFNLRDFQAGDGEIGLEDTIAAYVQSLVQVGAELHRVLKPTGTLWIVIDDSRSGSNKGQLADGSHSPGNKQSSHRGTAHQPVRGKRQGRRTGDFVTRWGGGDKWVDGMPRKNLMGIPERVVLALQEWGWIWRDEIIWKKPNPMRSSAKDRTVRSHEKIYMLAKGQWVSRIVKFSDLDGKRVHFLDDLGAHVPVPPLGWPPARIDLNGITEICVRLAASVLYATQRQNVLGLPSFDAEIWQQGRYECDGNFIGSLPIEHRAAVLCAWFLTAQRTTKEFLCQLDSAGIALADGDHLIVAGWTIKVPLPPSVYADGEGTIAIHYAGEICKVDLIHHKIISLRPSTCSYYYDIEAISEPRRWYDRRSASSIVFGEAQERRKPGYEGRSRRAEAARERGDTEKDWVYPLSVWEIRNPGYRGPHHATYPLELATKMVLAGCPPDGVVLDPFIGRGTTCIAAQNHERRSIGVDLNPNYIWLSSKELMGISVPPGAFDERPDKPQQQYLEL